MGLHQEAKEVNPAIIRKYLRMRSLVQCLHPNPTCRSLLSERMLALSSVTEAIEGSPSPAKRNQGQWMIKEAIWTYSRRWRPFARVS